MSRARKAREAVIPRDEDFERWRKLIAKSVHPKRDFDRLGRKLWGHADETKRVYACSADHTLHIRSFVRLRPLLEAHRKCNGADGELPAIECCADGRTVRFARDPSIPEDEEKRIQEEEAHGDTPGHTASLYAYSSCRLYDHRANQDQMFSGFVPQALNAVLYGGHGCLVVYGEKGSGKSYTLLGTDGDKEYAEECRPPPRSAGEDGGPREDSAGLESGAGSREKKHESDDGLNASAGTAATTRPTGHPHERLLERGSDREPDLAASASHAAAAPTDSTKPIPEPEKDLVWLAAPDAGDSTGLLQRAIHSIFDRCRQGRLERQSRYRVEMNALLFKDGSDQTVGDLSSFDEHGQPRPLLVIWDPDGERFEAEGCNFVTYTRPEDMVWAALRANWMRNKCDPSGERTTVVYRIRVHLRGVGDPTWKDIVGDQLGEGQPVVGEFMIVEASGFSVGRGFPDPHTGNDGVFDSHETLRIITKVLESVKFNNLPALRKKHSVPYRMNPVTRLMSKHLKAGAVMTFLGCAGIDKAAHVGTLHTLWCASAVQRPRTHTLRMKRAKNKLKVVAMLAGAGATWASRSTEEKQQRRTEAKSHVFEHVTEHLEHILSDKHKHRTGQDEWSAEHQTQLLRAQPRLKRRVSNRGLMTNVSTPDVKGAPRSSGSPKNAESQRLGASGEEAEQEAEEDELWQQRHRRGRGAATSSSKVTNWISSRDGAQARREGPRLKGFGGELDKVKGFLSPYVQVLKMPEVRSVPPPPGE